MDEAMAIINAVQELAGKARRALRIFGKSEEEVET